MGGGTMRAAAKVAGFTAANAVHQHGASISRRVSSVRAAAAATEDVKLVATRPEGDVDKACLEVDDWIHVDHGIKSKGRVVFGGAPSLREAKEATSELTEALENAYKLSPGSVGYLGSAVADHEALSPLSQSSVQTKDCVTSEVSVTSPIPAPAFMAFKLLRESPVAQNVVASIACDQNVWNAVMQNPELQEFVNSQRACLTPPIKDSTVEFSSDSESFNMSSQVSSDEESNPTVGGFQNILHKIKISVLDMISSLSGFFNNLFSGGHGSSEKVVANADGTARINGETVMEASFMGLAIMAILVVLLKRG